MKLIMSAFCVAALSGALVAAQASEVKTKQKIEVKDGKKVTVSGCVQQGADGLMLTDVEGNVSHSYMLVGKSDDIAKHIGHRVEITGKAADRGDGKVKVETKTKAPGAPEQKAESKSEGDLDVPLLGVDHVKMIGKSCR